ncbi:unnamed protein product [Owenia fusiformis]|uniref:[histone H3]-dimethyl-L-lysine(36) demethylase n=1 Tax=Owenia fusiformis TaxID=6347 RepID=A0A8S4Q7P5_OWEFU|nr:unnamed protein product [Owenia fusiformis]
MTEEDDVGRRLRHKTKKVYSEEIGDDEIEGSRTYSIESILQSDKFDDEKLVKVMEGKDVTVAYWQKHGFDTPIVVHERSGLGMRVPSENFKVNDVKQCVGSRRVVDVMDVNTQKALMMTMKEWVSYYTNPDRSELLNVISLEFSHTKLENYVECPQVVRSVDWVDHVWPRYLKLGQTESTNVIEKMKYPKVQKYCLMSVAGCYTDFHIDFGGTSVWYHILHGEKIFWLIEPTEENLQIYEEWTLSANQGDVFLATQVKECQKIHLKAGYTFFIPTGWIHAVYTPKDSLVFGGNFLHNFGIPMQIRVAEVEEKTHVNRKFRYPFFAEMHWYLLERYVSCLTGKKHRVKTEEEIDFEKTCEKEGTRTRKKKVVDGEVKAEPESVKVEETTVERPCSPKSPILKDHSYGSPGHMHVGSPRVVIHNIDDLVYPKSPASGVQSPVSIDYSDIASPKSPESVRSEHSKEAAKEDEKPRPKVHLTKAEINGLKRVCIWLDELPSQKKSIPRDIPDPEGLLRDAQSIIMEHEAEDDPLKAVTGEIVLQWPAEVKKLKIKRETTTYSFPRKHAVSKKGPRPIGNDKLRKRRGRCKRCEPCTRSNCKECTFCHDMKMYGGPGRMKQSCMSRRCLAPVLPSTVECMMCKNNPLDDEGLPTVLECGICWEIFHPECFKDKHEDLKDKEGVINEDLPNSWECPKCCNEGLQGQIAPSRMRLMQRGKDGRQSSTESQEQDIDVTTNSTQSVQAVNVLKLKSTVLPSQDVNPKVKLIPLVMKSEGSLVPNANGHIEEITSGQKQVVIKVQKIDSEIPTKIKTEINGDGITDNDSDVIMPRSPPRVARLLESPIRKEPKLVAIQPKIEVCTSPTNQLQSEPPRLSKQRTTKVVISPKPSSPPPRTVIIRSPTRELLSAGGDAINPVQISLLKNVKIKLQKSTFGSVDSKKLTQQSSSSENSPSQNSNMGHTGKSKVFGQNGDNKNAVESPCRTLRGSTKGQPHSDDKMSDKKGTSPERRKRTNSDKEGKNVPKKKVKVEPGAKSKADPTSPIQSTPVRKTRTREVCSDADSSMSDTTSPRTPRGRTTSSNWGSSPGSTPGSHEKKKRRSRSVSFSSPESPDRAQPGRRGRGRGQGQIMKRGKGSSPSGRGTKKTQSSELSKPGRKPMKKDGLKNKDRAGGKKKKKDPLKRKTRTPSKDEAEVMKKLREIKGRYVVRPAPIKAPSQYVQTLSNENHPLNRNMWNKIFLLLDQKDMCKCMRVCKSFYRWCLDQQFWVKIDLNRQIIRQQHLIGVVLRQPQSLDLSYTNISHKQLQWLVARIPQLKSLSLDGNSWSSISALCSSQCPLLETLDINWCTGVKDDCVRDLVSPPCDHRPGVKDISRLNNLKTLRIAGCDITDDVISVMTLRLASLQNLDLSYCVQLTDNAVQTIAKSNQLHLNNLQLNGCNNLTNASLTLLKKCKYLKMIGLEKCRKIKKQKK